MNKDRFKIFDVLVKKRKWQDWSKWTGQNNDIYTFQHSNIQYVNSQDAKKPIAWVYKNNKYLTGLFLTKRPDQYSGDLKTDNRRTFLLFKIVNRDKINIYELVQKDN
jgi:hypothetical protein